MRVKALLLAAALALAGASSASAFRLTSPAFRSGAAIPKRFTCDGADVSPPLRWTAPPRRTRSLALVFEDTSTAPPFMHWLAWRLAPRGRGLVPGARPTLQGRNDFGRTGAAEARGRRERARARPGAETRERPRPSEPRRHVQEADRNLDA